MPMYDYSCACGHTFEKLRAIADSAVAQCPECGQDGAEKIWTSSGNVIGDEIDVWINNGLCHDNGDPRHFTSRSELFREAKAKGLINPVSHVAEKGSDKSRHTSRWV